MLASFDFLSQPTTLTLVTTSTCTSACRSCCFHCSPHRKESISQSKAITYINICTTTFPSISTLVLTGGEPLTMGVDYICNLIQHAHKKGLITRIVSNAYWASNFDNAKHIILSMASAGLNEINISTGNEHKLNNL